MNQKLSDIWNMEDVDEFVMALSEYVSEKCQYGEQMAVLTKPERVFYIAQSLQMEVENGGFSQFFYNTSGAFSGELAGAFAEIGAHRIAEICKAAVAVFGREIPVDRREREELLDQLEGDGVNEALEACDNAFYEAEEELISPSYAYIMRNRASFT